MRFPLLVCLAFAFTSPLSAAELTIRSTVLIGEAPPKETDGWKAAPGKLQSPFGIDFDGAGNMVIVELEGGRVHRLSPDGQFTTLAGDGSRSYTGDDGPAAKATFNGMDNVPVKAAGEI